MAYYIGVMSGTSLDGVDIAITSLSKSGEWTFIAGHTFPFPDDLLIKLQHIINTQQCALIDLGEIHVSLGQFVGQSINQLLQQQQLTKNDITAIGSHGQTIFHQPNGSFPFSLQIGDANQIAEITAITTIADFRQRDIAAGGQGAPLVPAFHKKLFSSSDEDRVIINIGGISNITLLVKSPTSQTLGFDTGPGNVLLDSWVQRHQNKAYDADGLWAASGQINNDLLSLFLSDPYFELVIPKSTGRELFNTTWLDQKLEQFKVSLRSVDIQATLVELTARTITDDIKRYATNTSAIYVCGGGSHNRYLLDRLRTLLPNNPVSTTSSLGLHPDWVEACAFAWLAYRTLNHQTGNLPSVTGANHPVILGAIYPA